MARRVRVICSDCSHKTERRNDSDNITCPNCGGILKRVPTLQELKWRRIHDEARGSNTHA